MKGSPTLYASMQLLMVAFLASQVTALTPEQTCPLVKNNTYIADPSDCQGWVFCRDGKPYYGKCSENFFYDSTKGVCDYSENVECNTNVNTMCAGLNDVFKADPYNCARYCYCREGETHCRNCPNGQVFDPEIIECVWATSSKCEAGSPCLLVQNGFMADANTCNGYLRCGSSQIVAKGECPADRYFNPSIGMCDYKQNVPCASEPTTSPPTTTDPVAPADLCQEDDKFYSDGKTCRGYFWCETANSNGLWAQCPKGTHFSENLQQCVDPDMVACEQDRCEGMTKPFMTVAKTNCKQYYNCKDGVKFHQGSCPEEHPYFNELIGACQDNALSYPVCL